MTDAERAGELRTARPAVLSPATLVDWQLWAGAVSAFLERLAAADPQVTPTCRLEQKLQDAERHRANLQAQVGAMKAELAAMKAELAAAADDLVTGEWLREITEGEAGPWRLERDEPGGYVLDAADTQAEQLAALDSRAALAAACKAAGVPAPFRVDEPDVEGAATPSRARAASHSWDHMPDEPAPSAAVVVSSAGANWRPPMPTQADGALVLQIAIRRGPDAGPNECGVCEYLECNGEKYCEAFAEDLPGSWANRERCPACLAAAQPEPVATVALRKRISELESERDAYQMTAEEGSEIIAELNREVEDLRATAAGEPPLREQVRDAGATITDDGRLIAEDGTSWPGCWCVLCRVKRPAEHREEVVKFLSAHRAALAADGVTLEDVQP